jgi:hypothetical protein
MVVQKPIWMLEMSLLRNLLKFPYFVIVLGASVANADHLPVPAGDVILTVKGEMTQANTPDGAELDLEMLRRIGTVTFSTSTPWTDGVQDFTGVPLNQLLVHLGAKPESMTVTAINEYQIKVPGTDAVDGGPILAWEQGGKLLSIREKGPLWLIYPFDSKAEYQREEIHARAVWQVVQIDLIP